MVTWQRYTDPHSVGLEVFAEQSDKLVPQSYAGNPNGNIAAQKVGVPCWDSTNSKLYIATAADGTIGGTTWTAQVFGPTQPVTVDNETGTISGSRQLVSGLNTTVNTGTAGQIKIDVSAAGVSTGQAYGVSVNASPLFMRRIFILQYGNHGGSIQAVGGSFSSTAGLAVADWESTALGGIATFGWDTLMGGCTGGSTAGDECVIRGSDVFTEPTMKPVMDFIGGFHAMQTRRWIGMWDADPHATDTPGASGISGWGFRFSTTAGDTGNGHWRFVTSNGSSDTVVDTGVACATLQMQNTRIDASDPTHIHGYVDGVDVTGSVTTTLPASTAKLNWYALNVSDGAHPGLNIVWVVRLYIESN